MRLRYSDVVGGGFELFFVKSDLGAGALQSFEQSVCVFECLGIILFLFAFIHSVYMIPQALGASPVAKSALEVTKMKKTLEIARVQ